MDPKRSKNGVGKGGGRFCENPVVVKTGGKNFLEK
jgi:hypothetical protein